MSHCTVVIPLRSQPWRVQLLAAIVLTASILLAQDQIDKATRLTAPDVAALEKQLADNPDDLEARGTLITYYAIHVQKPDRLRHCLWLAEHHPEAMGVSPYAWIAAADSPLDSMETFEKARTIWLQHAELRITEPRVLVNAAGFISQFDPNLSERLILQARELEPKDRRWEEQLGGLYGKAIFTDGRFRPQTPPSPERQAFAKRARLVLEKSDSAMIVGRAGLRLAPQDVTILRTRSAENIELGERLLKKARDLAPQDPQWGIYLADFEAARKEAAEPEREVSVTAPVDARPGTLLKRVEPAYPEPARKAGIQGTVELRILLGISGRVIVVIPTDGPAELQAAAASAVKQWVFSPILMKGQPIEQWKNVGVRFDLSSARPQRN